MKLDKKNQQKYITTSLLLLIGLLAGVVIAAQFRIPNREAGPVASVTSLKDAKSILDQDHTDLSKEITDARNIINSKQNDLKSNQKISNNLVDQAQNLRNQAGLTDKKGSGLVITLADSQESPATTDSIIHAADIRDVVNVLWQSGATAVSINDQRIVVSTSIDSIVNTVLVNNINITNPFVIKAIGDQSKMKSNLDKEGNLVDLKDRKKSTKLIFNIESAKEVNIPSYDGGFSITNATTKESN